MSKNEKMKLVPGTTYELIASRCGKPIKFLNAEYEFLDHVPLEFTEVNVQAFAINDLWLKDNQERVVYFDFELRKIVFCQKQIKGPEIDMEELVFESYTLNGEPIMTYKGETLRGYAAISQKLYGEYYNDIDRRVNHLLEDDFDPDELYVKGVRKNKYGKEYTLYSYGQQEINGFSGLKRRFPKTPEKRFKGEFPDYKLKYLQLIEEYNIMRFGKDYILDLNPDKIFTSQVKLIGYLKSEYGEEISTKNRVRLFQELQEYRDYLVSKYSLSYNKKTRTCEFYVDGAYFPDRTIDEFLTYVKTPQYKELRDDLINYLTH